MSLLTVLNVSHAYGTHQVLDGATVSIEAGEKVGLVGRNGQGKTTLMRVMMGQLKPDSGSANLQRNARVGYLSQDPSLDLDETLRDAAEGAFEHLHELHRQQHALYDQMATAQGDALDKLMRKQSELEAAVDAAGGYAIDHKIDAMLHGLGFSDEQFAKLLLQQPDLLLLDEPTNHLDIVGRQWLEEFLADEYPGAVVVVSHDRWLLDRVVGRIIEVERGVIREYPGNYHKYLELRRERQLTEARVYDKQQDKIRSEEQFIRRYKAGQRAKQAQGRLARLERFKRDEVVDRPIELDVMNLALPKAARSGDQVLAADGISKRYGDKVLFHDFSTSIMRGERIGLIGPNGAGKTTLVRCLLGELPADEGKVRTGSRLSIGYYRQLHEHLDLSLNVWQYLQSVIVTLDGQAKASEQQARDLAGAFLFSGGDQEKPLSLLSGGERSRVVLAGLVAGAHNVLVLDEPTNHLDIPSGERLEQVLADDENGFGGTLLLISHDRALLESTCDKLLVFDGHGGVSEFLGTYSEWARKQRERAAVEAERASGKAKQAAKPVVKPVAKPQAAAQKEQSSATAVIDKAMAKLAKMTMEQVEQTIEKTQSRIKAIDGRMMEPDIYRDRNMVRQLQAERDGLAAELEPLEFEWARRAES
jgi:ATP-binding cassette, subfamily F, member 3